MASCGTTGSSSCPPLREYSDIFNTTLADEVDALPDDSALVIVVIDYFTLRRQIEACRE